MAFLAKSLGEMGHLADAWLASQRFAPKDQEEREKLRLAFAAGYVKMLEEFCNVTK